MAISFNAESTLPVLLYRATCPKCRIASTAIVVLSCGRIRRIPIDSPEAHRLYTQYGQLPGKLALLCRGQFRTGSAIPLAMLRALVDLPWSRTAQYPSHSHSQVQ
jgi:hypothetical protein